jgi:hypothetical protein
MGRLVMEARGSAATGAGQGMAAAGNSDEMPIVVSITNADGAPVSGLGAADITIKVRWADQGEPPEVRWSGTIGPHGDYVLAVYPARNWAAGRHIFLLTAKSGANQGQTLCDVVVH